jgi:hypothetical protein
VEKKQRSRIRISDSTEESSSSEEEDSSSSEEEGNNHTANSGNTKQDNYRIPKLIKNGPWSSEELENFRKNWPQLRNFDDSILKNASLKELAGIGKSKSSHSKLLSDRLARNYETVLNFPTQIEAGTDDCVGRAHSSRFIRGYVADHQELWIQARTTIGVDGLDPITNYELLSMGVGDLLTPPVWEELHKPNSRILSIRMLSTKSVELAWRHPDRSEALKDFESIQELKVAMATLDTAVLKIMPWNMAFKTLNLFLILNDFGASDLSGKSSRLLLLTGFVDEVLRINARNWEERKKYLSHQELCVKWAAFLSRNQVQLKGADTNFKKRDKHTQGAGFKKFKPPGWVCRRFNNGDCDSKDTKHPSSWDPNYHLKHVCAKMIADGKFCLKDHSEKDHK